MQTHWYLVADIGGTNARFAAYEGDRLAMSVSHEVAGCDDLLSLAVAFCKTLPARPAIAVVAAAGPVENNAVTLTNANHTISGEALRQATGAERAYVINDFAAAAWATADIGPGDVKAIAGGADPDLRPGTRVIIGPGTGLGIGALVFDGVRYQCVTGEGGHIGLGARTAYETSVFQTLRHLWPEVFFGETLIMEAEGILGGVGLPLLYRAVQMTDGQAVIPLTPEEIFRRAKAGNDPAAGRTIAIFKAHLARLSGDLGMIFGPTSSVIFVGGMALKNPWLFDAGFRTLMSEGGRFSRARSALNLYLFQHDNFGLRGAHKFAKRQSMT